MRNILFLIIVLFISSCQESPEAKFEKDGVSFISPEGWEVTEEENLDNEGYYLAIERDGFNSSGLITITWANYEIDLDEWLNVYVDDLKSNIIYKNSNISFSNVIESEFSEISTKTISFKVSIVGVKHEGVISAFYANNRTFSILKQEAIEDKLDNKKGFDLIEKSFKIEEVE